MIIRINEESFDITEALGGAAIGDLLTLKLKSKTPDFLGVSVPSIQRCFVAMGAKAEAAAEAGGEFKMLDLLGDEEFLYSMLGLIFLARRSAGEVVTWESVGRTKFTDIELIADDDEEAEAEEDPKAPTVGEVAEPVAV